VVRVLWTPPPAAVLGCAACSDGGRRGGEACGASPAASSPTRMSRVSILAVVQPLVGRALLARFDPLTLEPVSHGVAIAEYHDTWSLSPDRKQLALGISMSGRVGRIGVIVVDLDRLKVVRGIETGVAAEALGWLRPRALVAGLQRGGTVLLDPRDGKILRRWPAFSFPEASGRTRDGVVLLFGGKTPRLAVADAGGRLRSVALRRIHLGVRAKEGVQYADRAGLAVDPVRLRAYVAAAGERVADVDLRTMSVSYHDLEQPESRTAKAALARRWDALWLGDGRMLAVGEYLLPAARLGFASVGAGAILVDTRKWSSCVLDETARGATLAGGRVLAYGRGLRAYTKAGHRTFELLAGQRVLDVQAARARGYVQTPRAVLVVDARTGKRIGTVVPPVEVADVISDGDRP
jgi:hypothetical protein